MYIIDEELLPNAFGLLLYRYRVSILTRNSKTSSISYRKEKIPLDLLATPSGWEDPFCACQGFATSIDPVNSS